jgi:hypothetical protein
MGFGLFWIISAIVWISIAMMGLLFLAGRIFPNFFRFKLKKCLDGMICVLGFLSPLAFLAVWAATHDIYHDYVSFANYKKVFPKWAESVESCHGEWYAFQIAMLLIIVFHLLLLARRLVAWATTNRDSEFGIRD